MTVPLPPEGPRTVPLASLLYKFEEAARFPSYRIQSDDLEVIVASLRVAVEREAASPAPLDVERLAQALTNLHRGGEQPKPLSAWDAYVYDSWTGPRMSLTPKGFAEAIAAEYARLTPEPSE